MAAVKKTADISGMEGPSALSSAQRWKDPTDSDNPAREDFDCREQRAPPEMAADR